MPMRMMMQTGITPHIRAALSDPELQKVKDAKAKLAPIADRMAPDTDPLTEVEWKDLRDARDLLVQALGESTTPSMQAIFRSRARTEATALARSQGGRR